MELYSETFADVVPVDKDVSPDNARIRYRTSFGIRCLRLILALVGLTREKNAISPRPTASASATSASSPTPSPSSSLSLTLALALQTVWIIEFYSDHCPICKNLIPEVAALPSVSRLPTPLSARTPRW